jgi:EF hand
MQSSKLWLAPALTAALVLVGAAVAQPPRPTQVPLPGPVQPAPISVDDVVERIMAFDKNKDGKVTKDELPERLHHLIARGDTNKDGALDRDEIKKLASTPGDLRFEARAGPRVQDFGGFRVAGRAGPGPGGAGPGPGDIEGVVDDLKLSNKKKDQALAAVKAHQENVRKLMDQARAELLQKMKEVLSEEELKDFKAALDRPRSATFISVGPRPTPGGDVERKPE